MKVLAIGAYYDPSIGSHLTLRKTLNVKKGAVTNDFAEQVRQDWNRYFSVRPCTSAKNASLAIGFIPHIGHVHLYAGKSQKKVAVAVGPRFEVVA